MFAQIYKSWFSCQISKYGICLEDIKPRIAFRSIDIGQIINGSVYSDTFIHYFGSSFQMYSTKHFTFFFNYLLNLQHFINYSIHIPSFDFFLSNSISMYWITHPYQIQSISLFDSDEIS